MAESAREDLVLLQTELSMPELSDELISLFSDEDVRAEFLEAVAGTGDEELTREINTLVVSLAEFVVIDIKRSLLDTAEEVGSLVTSFFILFGLFSIIVGILLIFLIFVMLAAARRSELGMARAVGAKRWHLVQMFVFEGTAYSLVSGVVGVGLGLLASALIVGIINQIFAGGGAGADDFQLTRHFELRSAIVAYCLGMVITFITVGFFRVPGQPDEHRGRGARPSDAPGNQHRQRPATVVSSDYVRPLPTAHSGAIFQHPGLYGPANRAGHHAAGAGAAVRIDSTLRVRLHPLPTLA